MIIEAKNETILGNGAKSSAFTIQASPKVFKILSSDLYTNKERAVVRELITNMIDAHSLNGFKGKFHIKAPSELDPRFVVRDFGPGMSDFDIRGDEENPGLYNSYFASSKAGSNDFIGGFGLGSKSPFSYTDTFNIVSYHNGEVRGYTAYMDNGGPQIKPTFVEPMTDEDQTGMEIVVPTKPFDIHKWRSEIEYIMRPFGADAAEITGMDSSNIDYFPEFEEYYFKDDVYYGAYERHGLWAIYGGIVYPLEPANIKSNWISSRHQVCYIKFPMGSLDIAPSREALSLDERTLKNIHEKIKELDERIFKEETTSWQTNTNAREVYRELRSLNYQCQNYLNHKLSQTYTSRKLTYAKLSRMFDVPREYAGLGVVYEVGYDPKLKRIKVSGNSSVCSTEYIYGHQRKKLYLVLDDCKKNRLPALRALYDMHCSSDEKAKQILTDNPWLPPRGTQVVFFDINSEREIDMIPDILELFDEDEVIIKRTSEIYEVVEDYVTKVTREYVPRPKAASAVEWTLTDDYWAHEDKFITAAEADEIDGYVVFINNTSLCPMDSTKGQLGNVKINDILSLAKDQGIHKVTVVRPTLHKKVIKLDQCECLLSLLYDTFIELIDTVDYTHYTARTGRAYNYTKHTQKYPDIAFLEKYFNESGVTTKESQRLAQYNSILGSAYTNECTNEEWKQMIQLCSRIVARLQSAAEHRAIKKVEKFEAENIIVSDYMRGRYELSDAVRLEIIKLMGV